MLMNDTERTFQSNFRLNSSLFLLFHLTGPLYVILEYLFPSNCFSLSNQSSLFKFAIGYIFWFCSTLASLFNTEDELGSLTLCQYSLSAIGNGLIFWESVYLLSYAYSVRYLVEKNSNDVHSSHYYDRLLSVCGAMICQTIFVVLIVVYIFSDTNHIHSLDVASKLHIRYLKESLSFGTFVILLCVSVIHFFQPIDIGMFNDGNQLFYANTKKKTPLPVHFTKQLNKPSTSLMFFLCSSCCLLYTVYYTLLLFLLDEEHYYYGSNVQKLFIMIIFLVTKLVGKVISCEFYLLFPKRHDTVLTVLCGIGFLVFFAIKLTYYYTIVPFIEWTLGVIVIGLCFGITEEIYTRHFVLLALPWDHHRHRLTRPHSRVFLDTFITCRFMGILTSLLVIGIMGGNQPYQINVLSMSSVLTIVGIVLLGIYTTLFIIRKNDSRHMLPVLAPIIKLRTDT